MEYIAEPIAVMDKQPLRTYEGAQVPEAAVWRWYGLVALVIAAIAALTSVSLGGLAGDSVIHLIFAEHAMSGHWFEFNPGTASGGETSPLYMLGVIALYAGFGPSGVPYALQFAGAAAWLVLLLAVWRLARLLGAERGWALVLVTMCGLMPGSARNAVMGMENIYFAAGLLAWLGIATKARWFEQPLSWSVELGYGLLAGLLACLRPEGAVVVAVLMTARACNLGLDRAWTRWILGGAVAAGLLGVQTYAYWKLAGGELPFAGGLARRALAAAHGWEVAGVSVDGTILIRWMAYAPLGLLMAAALFGMMRSVKGDDSVVLGPRRAAWAMTAVVLVSTVLFMTVFSSGHLGRYTIYYWPLVVLAGWAGAAQMLTRLWREGGWRRALVWGPVTALLAVYSVEAVVRVRTLGPGHALQDVSLAPGLRKLTTDKVLAELQMPGATSARPAVVGMVEVQSRYWWDGRVRVASLDGIVDSRLRPFIRHGFYDHLGFAKAVQMTHIADFPNFNRDPRDFSLADLAPLKKGDVVLRDSLRLEKLPGGAIKVD
jgi:hypothetical protein